MQNAKAKADEVAAGKDLSVEAKRAALEIAVAPAAASASAMAAAAAAATAEMAAKSGASGLEFSQIAASHDTSSNYVDPTFESGTTGLETASISMSTATPSKILGESTSPGPAEAAVPSDSALGRLWAM